ncbi:MAG TPA: serine hydrolase [Actinomycetota bacterium]|nr:serine hydrolase [Actinomycetota bacterium]
MSRPAETVPPRPDPWVVAPGFQPVRQTFADNFAHRGELGAACAVYRHGEPVVDLWGGLRDRGLPGCQDTLLLVFSVTKGMTATALTVVHARGLLDHDTPVAAYWPELAEAGKAAITVRQVLAHQAGLATIDQRLRLVDLADQERLGALIAGQRSQWPPGTRKGYHYLTFGWIAAELIGRIDPAGRTLGRFFGEEVAAPLGLDFHIGLPPDLPDERVARIKVFHGLRLRLHPRTMPPGMLLAFAAPRSLTARTLGNPRLASPGAFDRPELRPIQIPAAGGIGTVRAVARCFGELATDARTLGLTDRTLNELTAPGLPPADGWGDLVWHTDIRYSAGFLKPCPPAPLGPATARSVPKAPAAHSASPTPTWPLATPTPPTGSASTWSMIPAGRPSAPPSTAALVSSRARPAATADRRAAIPVRRPTVSTASPGLSSLLPPCSELPAGQGYRAPSGDGTRLHAIVAGAGRPWC